MVERLVSTYFFTQVLLSWLPEHPFFCGYGESSRPCIRSHPPYGPTGLSIKPRVLKSVQAKVRRQVICRNLNESRGLLTIRNSGGFHKTSLSLIWNVLKDNLYLMSLSVEFLLGGCNWQNIVFVCDFCPLFYAKVSMSVFLSNSL